VFGRVDYIGIMLFHDQGNKKKPAFAGFLVAGIIEISKFELTKAVDETNEMACNLLEGSI